MIRTPAALRPLRHRDFRLLWAGLAVSLTGSGLWLVALAWQVISLGGGPVSVAISLAIVAVVAVLVAVFTKGRLAYESGRGAAA